MTQGDLILWAAEGNSQTPCELRVARSRGLANLFMTGKTQSIQVSHIAASKRIPKTQLMNLGFTQSSASLKSPGVSI